MPKGNIAGVTDVNNAGDYATIRSTGDDALKNARRAIENSLSIMANESAGDLAFRTQVAEAQRAAAETYTKLHDSCIRRIVGEIEEELTKLFSSNHAEDRKKADRLFYELKGWEIPVFEKKPEQK